MNLSIRRVLITLFLVVVWVICSCVVADVLPPPPPGPGGPLVVFASSVAFGGILALASVWFVGIIWLIAAAIEKELFGDD
jgi:hypothetical protein